MINYIVPPDKKKYQDVLQIDLDDYIFEDIDIVLILSLPGRYKKGDPKFDKYGHRKILKVRNIFKSST
jgi:hypothetical protein